MELTEDGKLKMDDIEYSQEDLDSLVGLGKMAREAEEKYNTKIDKVWPEYGKTKGQLKEYEDKVKDYETKIAEYETKLNNASARINNNPNDEQAIAEAKAAARKLGILLNEDVSEKGFVTKDNFREMFNTEMAGRELLGTMKGMEKSINGEDGRPKFDVEEMLNFMQETGIQDPEIAYKVKHEKELSEWKDKKVKDASLPGYSTITQGGSKKEPPKVNITRDNLADLVRERLEKGNS